MKFYSNGGNLLVPRIFISSTFYDLKYARENLGDFIENYGFEVIRFEKGDVGYTPGEELDESCYVEMANSNMAIVIIGGRYGSPSSDNKLIENSFDKYMSVTHKEFRAAVENNIPIYIFIEQAVYNEYQIYEINKKSLENNKDFNLYAADNINVYRFIHNIRKFSKLPIFEFKEIKDIKFVLRKQWAHIFYEYLNMKKEVEPIGKVQSLANNIDTKLKKMDVLLKKIGEETFNTQSKDYQDVLLDQKIENAAGKISSTFEFVSSLKDIKEIKDYMKFFIDQLFVAYEKDLLEYPFFDNISDINKFYSLFQDDKVVISAIKEHLKFEENIFDKNDESYKNRLVERLIKRDYLEKMGFFSI